MGNSILHGGDQDCYVVWSSHVVQQSASILQSVAVKRCLPSGSLISPVDSGKAPSTTKQGQHASHVDQRNYKPIKQDTTSSYESSCLVAAYAGGGQWHEVHVSRAKWTFNMPVIPRTENLWRYGGAYSLGRR